jgi:molybdate transport system ATP-binding protein
MIDIDISRKLSFATGEGLLTVKEVFNDQEDIIGISGVSGSGKTTLLRIIAGLEDASEGRIVYNDELWFDSSRGVDVPVQKRPVGFVSQDFNLFPHMTVEENMSYACDRKETVTSLLHLFGLHELAHVYPSRLSGGQKQRVAIGRALARGPELLLLDEPFSALDEETKHRVEELIFMINDRLNVPILYVSHNRQDIISFSTTALVLEQGKVISRGKPGAVLNNENSSTIDLKGDILTVQENRGRYIAHIEVDNTLISRIMSREELIRLGWNLNKSEEIPRFTGKTFSGDYKYCSSRKRV